MYSNNPQFAKDYYRILGISMGESNLDIIRNAYKSLCATLHPDVYKGNDCEAKTAELNEAYLVLTDTELKKQYDLFFCTHDENCERNVPIELMTRIALKQEEAKQFTSQFFAQYLSHQQRKKGSNWLGISLLVVLILSVLGGIARGCKDINDESHSQRELIKNVGDFEIPSSWATYNIENSFSISIPSTMEIRREDDAYTKYLKHNTYAISNSNVVFQQRNLSSFSDIAMSTYCRVIITHASDNSFESLHYDETEEFDADAINAFDNLVNQEVAPYTLIEGPVHSWIDINGTKAIQSSYRRQGQEGPVNCKMYILFNYQEMAKIIVAYREKDAEQWRSDMQNVIRTFRWNNPQ